MAFTEHRVNSVVFRTADGLSSAGGVVHAFSTRYGGVSRGVWSSMNLGISRGDSPEDVEENYRRFRSAVGAEHGKLVRTRQVHKDRVRVITGDEPELALFEPAPEADALVTDRPGVALIAYSADCIPVLLYDPVRRAAGVAHAGWRGTSLGIAARTAETMVHTYGCDTKDILAAIGPGIGPCCFETDGDVPDAMRTALGSAADPYMTKQENGKWHVDLKEINAHFLRSAGVQAHHIEIDPDCTSCNPDKYWSYRVTGDARGSTAALIQLKD